MLTGKTPYSFRQGLTGSLVTIKTGSDSPPSHVGLSPSHKPSSILKLTGRKPAHTTETHTHTPPKRRAPKRRGAHTAIPGPPVLLSSRPVSRTGVFSAAPLLPERALSVFQLLCQQVENPLQETSVRKPDCRYRSKLHSAVCTLFV